MNRVKLSKEMVYEIYQHCQSIMPINQLDILLGLSTQSKFEKLLNTSEPFHRPIFIYDTVC